MPKVTLAGEEFKTITALRTRLDEIKRKEPFQRCLDEKEAALLLEAIKLHPAYEERWKPKNVVSVIRAETDDQCWINFKVVLEDGTEDTFSPKNIGKKNLNYKWSEQIHAFREAVADQTYEYKKSKKKADGTWESEYSGEICTSCHVDHAIPFHKLITDFLVGKNLALSDVKLVSAKTVYQNNGYQLEEPLKTEFQEWHRANAKLMIKTPSENLNDAGTHLSNSIKYRKRKGFKW